jgi:glycosyltransferase involved in cell wall biosynthesis
VTQILKVWDSEYPWDVRTEKVCRELTEAGLEVHMVARNRDGRPLEEELEECTVHRMRPWPSLGPRLDAASQFPAFLNPRWKRHIETTGRRHSVRAILVRDIPLGPTAIGAGRRLGVPVILDMAENYPAMIRDLWATGSTRLGDSLVRNPRFVGMVERYVLSHVHHTLVVVEESKERLISLGVPADQVSVVSNTPSLARVEEFAALQHTRSDRSVEADAVRPFRLVYLGLMEEARGVTTVIEALSRVRKAGVAATLELIGDGRALPDFKELARTLGMDEEVVRFRGFVPYQDALADVAGADAGLIPHFANESWQTTIPNKLFDYMSLGLPVLSSDVRPVARVLAETGAGVTFRDRDAGDLAQVIERVASDPDRRAMGQRGLEAVRSKYHWERDGGVLRTVLERVLSAGEERRPQSEGDKPISSSRRER